MIEAPNTYTRPDGVRMLEIAPGQWLNETAALALGLAGPRSAPRADVPRPTPQR